MIEEILPELFRIEIPLLDSPLKYLNSYVLRSAARNVIVDTGLNRKACLNAMQHGNKGRPDARVVVTMKFDDETLSVSVRDEGDGISELPDDAETKEKIEKLEAPKKGLGTYLIRQLVDQVEFNEVTTEGHAVKMVLKLDNPSGDE